MVELSWVEAELLLALWHLRYLGTDQIWKGWYPDRTLTAVQKRLSRLKAAGVVARNLIGDERYGSAWQLAAVGYRELRKLKGIVVEPFRPVGNTFLPHLLDTNGVFAALARGEVVWERLPFKWLGSHRCAIPFARGPSDKRGVIRPDSIIEPKNSARRIFVELDRSTECIRHRDGRRSIQAKLMAYRRALLGHRQSAIAEHFQDERSPSVLFVTSRNDDRAADPNLRNRRGHSIMAAAETIFMGAEEDYVACVGLADTARLRAFVLGEAATVNVHAILTALKEEAA